MRKLYYEDSHIKTFTATVTGCDSVDNGYAVTLDATAFYPEGGGQACDIGRLGRANVFAVKEVGEQVVHYCDKPLAVGEEVQGTIDWNRRFDLMQQHAGEHVVSGIIHKLYGYHNVGFHIGADVVTIDFDGPLHLDELRRIEDMANEAIWQNLPVKCYYPSREELPNVNYRRKKDLPWPVRIVEIPGIDICACCGAQVQRTGEIGLVKLLTCVKFHQGVRIEMACGKRATTILGDIYDQNRLVSQLFSAKVTETADAAERVGDMLAAEKLRSAGLEERLFAFLAKVYRGQDLAVHFEQDLTPTANRELCNAIADGSKVAVTLSGTDETGYSLCIISRTEDAKALGASLIETLGGRGGGKREAFQGSTRASRADIEKFFQD